MNFDLENTRRKLIAKREAAGADTPLGHRCSNLIEQLQNYAKAESEDQRERLRASIQKSMSEIAGLQH